jgi:acetyl esterase/lipase
MTRFHCFFALLAGLCAGTIRADDSENFASRDDAGGGRRLTASIQPAPAKAPPGTRVERNLEYVANGHERHRLDLYLPEKGGRKFPVVIWLHGGAWIRGDKANCYAAPLVAKGYAAVSMNYRFLQHAEFPAQIEDCKAAVRWLRANAKKYNLDPERIGVMGASAGGYLAALLGTTGNAKELEGGLGNLEQSSRVQAVIDFFGPLRITKEKGNRSKVLSYVTKDACPFLIVHGDADKTVPIKQSEQLTEALKKAGVEVTLIPIKGAGHSGPAFFTDEMMTTYQAFFDKHLKKMPGK